MQELITLAEQKAEIKAEMEHLKSRLSNIESQIESIISEAVTAQRAATNKDTGTINMNINGLMIKHTVPKKVKWNQEILSRLANDIVNAGDDLMKYCTIEYKVPEKMFDSFQPEVQQAFMAARTVECGKPKIELEVPQ